MNNLINSKTAEINHVALERAVADHTTQVALLKEKAAACLSTVNDYTESVKRLTKKITNSFDFRFLSFIQALITFTAFKILQPAQEVFCLFQNNSEEKLKKLTVKNSALLNDLSTTFKSLVKKMV